MLFEMMHEQGIRTVDVPPTLDDEFLAPQTWEAISAALSSADSA